MSEAMHKHPDADVMVSFASLRSAYDSTIEAMKFPQVRNELHHNQYSVLSQTLTTTEHDISKTDLLCQWISIKVGLFPSLNTCTIYIYIYYNALVLALIPPHSLALLVIKKK